MNIRPIVWAAIAAVASSTIPFAAHADTVDARCDIYPRGEDRASAVTACTFSQRQGNVGIQLKNGRRYDLTPTGNQPGNYLDQNGQAAYRQSGLGDKGQIYRLANESIYVYWDTAGIPSSGSNTASQPGMEGTRQVTLRSNDPTAKINLRSSSTINSSTAGYGVPGDRVELVQCVQDRDTSGSDLNWCQVRFPSSSAVGWIRSDFIIFEEGGK